ncbi:MAG: PEP-CTERM sorting domain-containing protein [Sideroxyarcus sp.]
MFYKQVAKIFAIALFGILTCSNAVAVTERFTATSLSFGLLGYLEYDTSSFDGSSSQLVTNDHLLAINFTDPFSLNQFVTPGSFSEGTVIDSSSPLHTVVGGIGFIGGTDFSNGVWFFGTNCVFLADSYYVDVTWMTSEISVVSPVPESKTYAMLLVGLGLIGFMARRRKELNV